MFYGRIAMSLHEALVSFLDVKILLNWFFQPVYRPVLGIATVEYIKLVITDPLVPWNSLCSTNLQEYSSLLLFSPFSKSIHFSFAILYVERLGLIKGFAMVC